MPEETGAAARMTQFQGCPGKGNMVKYLPSVKPGMPHDGGWQALYDRSARHRQEDGIRNTEVRKQQPENNRRERKWN